MRACCILGNLRKYEKIQLRAQYRKILQTKLTEIFCTYIKHVYKQHIVSFFFFNT